MRFLFFTILIFISSIVLAQAPQGFTYQGVATNNEGIEISNQDISIRVSILAETASGNSVYLETHLTTTDAFGLFNVVIGSGQTESDFSTIDWGSSAHFLKIELDINGGSEYIHIGTQQMMSVPYALYAENSKLDSLAIDEMIKTANSTNEYNLLEYDNNFNLINLDLPNCYSGQPNIKFDNNGDIYVVSKYNTVPGNCNYGLSIELDTCNEFCYSNNVYPSWNATNAGIMVLKYDILGNLLDFYSKAYFEIDPSINGYNPNYYSNVFTNVEIYDIEFDNNNNMYISFFGSNNSSTSLNILKLNENLEFEKIDFILENNINLQFCQMEISNQNIYISAKNSYNFNINTVGSSNTIDQTNYNILIKLDLNLNYLSHVSTEGTNESLMILNDNEIILFDNINVLKYNTNLTLISSYEHSCNISILHNYQQNNTKHYFLTNLGPGSCFNDDYQVQVGSPDLAIIILDNNFNLDTILDSGVIDSYTSNYYISDFSVTDSLITISTTDATLINNNIGYSSFPGPELINYDINGNYIDNKFINHNSIFAPIGSYVAFRILTHNNNQYLYTLYSLEFLNNGQYVKTNQNSITVFKL